jgi:parvulin-like peptidyl-prolyl isomerase
MRRAIYAVVLLSACKAPQVPAAARLDVPATAPAPGSDEVIATVDGRLIRASDVAVQARAKGSTRKQALDDLIDAEVLAGEARRKAVKPNAEAIEPVRQAAVRALLKSTYERETTVDTVPEREVIRFYNKNRANFDHSKLVDVLHILVPTKGLSPEKKAEARKTAEALAQKARGVHTPDEFRALASPGQTVEDIQTARDGWVEKPFSEAAFDQLKKPGDVSGVVETSYGYHVLFLLKYVPELHQSIAEMTPRIREHLFPIWQRQHFLEWVMQLSKTHDVVVRADRLKK